MKGKKITKAVLVKAARTFIQAACGYLAVNIGGYVSEISSGNCSVIKPILLTLGTAAVSAGLAAVMNLEKGDEDA